MLDGLELPVVAGLHLQAGSPGHENRGKMMLFVERVNTPPAATKTAAVEKR